jgi:hypothetical protein
MLLLLLIIQSFDWLAAFHLELLQAILFIAVQLPAPVFLATCFKYCCRGLPTALFLYIASSRIFATKQIHNTRIIGCQTFSRRSVMLSRVKSEETKAQTESTA